jgi:hypothetical protein
MIGVSVLVEDGWSTVELRNSANVELSSQLLRPHKVCGEGLVMERRRRIQMTLVVIFPVFVNKPGEVVLMSRVVLVMSHSIDGFQFLLIGI